MSLPNNARQISLEFLIKEVISHGINLGGLQFRKQNIKKYDDFPTGKILDIVYIYENMHIDLFQNDPFFKQYKNVSISLSMIIDLNDLGPEAFIVQMRSLPTTSIEEDIFNQSIMSHSEVITLETWLLPITKDVNYPPPIEVRLVKALVDYPKS